jgi:hypothetical protein
LLSKTLKNNNIEIEDDDYDCILIENNIKSSKITTTKIDWDTNKEIVINTFSSFRNLMNKINETNIFVIINKFLKENFNDLLDKLSQKEFRLEKFFLYFLKKEFDEKINNNTIPKFSTKTYIYKMKNIRYIVIFDLNQHPLYIYDLQSSKIIDVQKCKILYQINHYSFKKPFITPRINYFYYYCINFFNKNNYFSNESQNQKFLELMIQIILKFNDSYDQYFSDEYLFLKVDNGDNDEGDDDDDDDDDNNNNNNNNYIKDFYIDISFLMFEVNTFNKFTNIKKKFSEIFGKNDNNNNIKVSENEHYEHFLKRV